MGTMIALPQLFGHLYVMTKLNSNFRSNSSPAPKPPQRAGMRGWLSGLGALAAGTFLSGAGMQADHPLMAGERGQVMSIVDGDTLYMEDGLKLRLSAMQAPKLPLGRPGFKAWPLAGEAKSQLAALCLGKSIQLYYGGLQRDRYDRALAQAILLDETGNETIWLQEEMIRLGYGRVYTWADTWQDSERLYAAERQARAAKRGIWADNYYKIRSPDPNLLAQDMDSFQLVEGIIVSTANIRGTTYLNFGANYRTDFTIRIDKPDMKRFKGWNMEGLEGAKIRVRGWVEMENGPVITLDHPERLEVLD